MERLLNSLSIHQALFPAAIPMLLQSPTPCNTKNEYISRRKIVVQGFESCHYERLIITIELLTSIAGIHTIAFPCIIILCIKMVLGKRGCFGVVVWITNVMKLCDATT
jgi:hypothetical protein